MFRSEKNRVTVQGWAATAIRARCDRLFSCDVMRGEGHVILMGWGRHGASGDACLFVTFLFRCVMRDVT